MLNVDYHKKGTTVFCMFLNKIEEYTVQDVYINITDKAEVSYSLKNSKSQTTKLNSTDVFQTKEELKEFVMSQFEEPKAEESNGEPEKS